MPKRKRGPLTLRSSGKWTPVALDQPFDLTDDAMPLEGLIDIEELTDYSFEEAGDEIKKQTAVKEGSKLEKKRKDRKSKRMKTDAATSAENEGGTSQHAASDSVPELQCEDSHKERTAVNSADKPKRKKREKKKARKISESADKDSVDLAAPEKLHPQSAPKSPPVRSRKDGERKKKNVMSSSDARETAQNVPENDDDDWEDIDDEDYVKNTQDSDDWEDVDEPSAVAGDAVVEDELSEKWSALSVSPEIISCLRTLHFRQPTPIQELCLPYAIRSRKGVIGVAETGSGKTLAFAIPIIQNIIEDKKNEKPNRKPYLRALILTPTRELASQIRNHIRDVTMSVPVSTCLIVGGMFKDKQDRLLKRNPDIVIATPGRLFDHVKSQTPFLSDLSCVRYLVIDEADRMVEFGHFQELTDILELMNKDPRSAAKRQNFVFSATLQLNVTAGPSKNRKKKNESEDKISNISSLLGLKSNAKLFDLSVKEGTAKSVVEKRLLCSLKDKDMHLYYLLLTEAFGRTIVFCNSLDCVRRLYGVFSYLLTESDRAPLVIHAGMHQKQRLKNLERFQANPKGVLLASDVASRGLDIPDVQYVIHYQVPRNPDLYVHRSGRTGRAFKVGCSVLIIDPSDASAYTKILKSLNRDRDFLQVEVDFKVLKIAKERIDLARRIDSVEHALRKQSSKDEWYLKQADDAGIDLDDNERRQLDIRDQQSRQSQSKEARMLKTRLRHLLSMPVKIDQPGFSKKYPALNIAKRRLLEEWHD